MKVFLSALFVLNVALLFSSHSLGDGGPSDFNFDFRDPQDVANCSLIIWAKASLEKNGKVSFEPIDTWKGTYDLKAFSHTTPEGRYLAPQGYAEDVTDGQEAVLFFTSLNQPAPGKLSSPCAVYPVKNGKAIYAYMEPSGVMAIGLDELQKIIRKSTLPEAMARGVLLQTVASILPRLECKDGRQSPSADEIRQAVSELGADLLETRQAAGRRLLAWGVADPDPILSALPTDDNDLERQRQADALRQQIPMGRRRQRLLAIAGDNPAWAEKIWNCLEDPEAHKLTPPFGNLPFLKFRENVQHCPYGAEAIAVFLAHEERNTKRLALTLLGELKQKKYAAQIAGSLDDPDPQVRFSAVLALGNLKSRDEIPALAKRLADPDATVRSYAALALGDLEASGEIPALEKGLDDPQMIISVIRALGKLKARALAPRLAGLLANSNDGIREAVASALEAIGDLSIAPQVAALLSHRDPDVRKRALQTLLRMDASAFADDAAAFLTDPDPDVRRTAVAAVGRFHKEGFAKLLTACLADPDGNVVDQALRTLGAARAYEAAGEVAQFLDRTETEWVAAKALGAMEARKHAPHLAPRLDALSKKIAALLDNNEHVADGAEILGKIGTRAQIPALARHLGAGSVTGFMVGRAIRDLAGEKWPDDGVEAAARHWWAQHKNDPEWAR